MKMNQVNEGKNIGSANLDRKTDVVVEARELVGWAILAMPPSPHWPEKCTADGARRIDGLFAALADEVERLREQWNTRFNTLCGLCGARYLGPRDEHLHGYGACDVPALHPQPQCHESHPQQEQCREASGDSSQATHGIKSPTLTPEGTDRAKIK